MQPKYWLISNFVHHEFLWSYINEAWVQLQDKLEQTQTNKEGLALNSDKSYRRHYIIVLAGSVATVNLPHFHFLKTDTTNYIFIIDEYKHQLKDMSVYD